MSIFEPMIRSLMKAQAWPMHSFSLPRFQSHRGFHQEGIPENTLQSLQKAAQLGAKMSEFDVQLCREGIPILFHDSDLRNQTGENTAVSTLSLKELQNRFPVTTLEEVLKDAGVPAYFNIELKTKKVACSLSRQVATLVQKYSAENRILFSSFNPFSLYTISQYLPNVPRALLVSNETSQENPWYLRQMWFAPALKLHMLNLDQEMLSAESLEYWKSRKIPISAWTVNDPVKVKLLLQMGVRSVISDLNPNLFPDL